MNPCATRCRSARLPCRATDRLNREDRQYLRGPGQRQRGVRGVERGAGQHEGVSEGEAGEQVRPPDAGPRAEPDEEETADERVEYGVFALFLSLLVSATAFYTGYVGDSLAVFDSHDTLTMSALAASALTALTLCFAVGGRQRARGPARRLGERTGLRRDAGGLGS
jgi:hypothetical protein